METRPIYSSRWLYPAEDIVQHINYMATKAHALAEYNGFWDDKPSTGEKIALMHSELSEALEADRKGNPPDDKVSHLTGVEAEMADCVIRIMDYCHHHNINLGQAIVDKHKFNETRPYKHGKKY